jgi:hypothetical protein
LRLAVQMESDVLSIDSQVPATQMESCNNENTKPVTLFFCLKWMMKGNVCTCVCMCTYTPGCVCGTPSQETTLLGTVDGIICALTRRCSMWFLLQLAPCLTVVSVIGMFLGEDTVCIDLR